MTVWGMVGWGLGVLLLASALAVVWLIAKRPLELFAWGSRRALARAGLRKTVVASPAGPQTVFVGGSGPTVVLLHGAGHQAGGWAPVVPSLAGRYRLVVPDLAGHGESAPAAGPIRTEELVAALEAVLGTCTADGPVTVVGNSLGAWMAMLLAARLPERVGRVVAVNGGALLAAPGRVNLMPRTREEARTAMAQLRDPASPRVPDNVLDDLVRQADTSPIARLAAGAAGATAFLLGEDDLRKLRLPVRLVWGASDELMTLDYARRMAGLLPDAEVIPVERCGHIPHQEAPERFAAALSKALGDRA